MGIAKLSEGYDFIEESFGLGQPTFTFYDEPNDREIFDTIEDAAEAYEEGEYAYH